MPTLHLTPDQRPQLIGWLHNEKDYLLSAVSMLDRIVMPRVSGSIETLRADLEFIRRLIKSVYSASTDHLDLSPDDTDTLEDVARSNTFADKEVFWTSILGGITR